MTIILSLIALIAFAIVTWRKFDHGLFAFFLLLPTYLIRFLIGPLPTTFLEIMLWIIFLIFIIQMIQKKLFTIHYSLFTSIAKQHQLLSIGSAFFLVAATIGMFVSTDFRAAAGEWKAFYIEPFLLFLILIVHLRDKKEMVKNLIFGLILSGLAVSLYAIIQKIAGGWMVPEAFWQSGRVTAWYGFPNGVGLFLAPLIPLALSLIKKDSEKNQNIIAILFLICAPLAVLFAKSTGGLVGIVGGIGILLLIWKKTRWPALAIGAVGMLVVLLLPNLSGIKTELLARDRSGQIRRAIWSETVILLEDHTLVGAGLASYSQKIAPYHGKVNGENIEIYHHPHNLLLTMWVNLGLLGAVGFVMILLWFYERMSHSKESMFIVATMTAILITGLVDSPYIKNDLSIFFWFVLALGVLLCRDNDRIIISEED